MSAEPLTIEADDVAIQALTNALSQAITMAKMDLDVQAVKEQGTDYIGFLITDNDTKSRITYMFPKGSGDEMTDLFDAGLSVPLQQVLAEYSRGLVESEGVDE